MTRNIICGFSVRYGVAAAGKVAIEADLTARGRAEVAASLERGHALLG